MKVKDCMTKEVQFVSPTTSLKEAAHKMAELDCGFLAIGKKEDDRLSGVITDRDITIRAVAKGLDPNEATVREIETNEVLYCFEEDSVESVTENMSDNQICRLIVLNNEQEKRLRGVITLGDVLRHNEASAAEKAAKGITSRQEQAA